MCSACGSNNQAEFPTEMMFHFSGLKNLDKPGVMIFPKVSICLECGVALFTVPETELAMLTSAPSVECAGR